MKLDDLLERIKQASEKVEETPKGTEEINKVPDNEVVEAQKGDEEKIEELLQKVEEISGEEKVSSESLLQAKLAEEMAVQSQDILAKEAEFFGTAMADAFMSRFEQANYVSEKQASEMEAANMASFYNAGQKLAEGYLDKLAETAEGGVVNETAIPAQVNQEEELPNSEELIDSIAQEITNELAEEGKSAEEKEAMFGKAKAVAGNILQSLRAGTSNAGKAIKDKGVAAGKNIAKKPYRSAASVAGAGAAGSGTYMALRNRKKESFEKISSEQVISDYLSNKITRDYAARLLTGRAE